MDVLETCRHTVFKEFDEANDSPCLSIIHFNDVYNIDQNTDSAKVVGGASKFCGLMALLREKYPGITTIFSGDILSPSTISTLVQGKQILELMPYLQIDFACIGNHDFDFGVDRTEQLVKSDPKCKWFLSNLFDYESGECLVELFEQMVVDIQGWKVGIMGLVEQDWIDTLGVLDHDDLLYVDFVECGEKIASKMKTEQNVDIVIAMTHMRMNNDTRLFNEATSIDVILGGHDHDHDLIRGDGRIALKSGTDFEELSLLQIRKIEGILKFNLDRYWTLESVPDIPEIKSIVDGFVNSMERELEQVIGQLATDLDGRFEVCRTQECNLGNFLCDCIAGELIADCVIINSGSLRSDRIHKAGPFTMRDLQQILPVEDPIVVFRCLGKTLVAALENGVSKWPQKEGRFPQVSGLKFTFDPSKDPGSRVVRDNIEIGGEILEFDAEYLVATKSYVHAGRDGYTMFEGCPLTVDDENGPRFKTCIRNFFTGVDQHKSGLMYRKRRYSRLSIVPPIREKCLLHEMTKLQQSQKLSFKSLSKTVSQILTLKEAVMDQHRSMAKREIEDRDSRRKLRQTEEYKKRMENLERKQLEVCPKVEGRINIRGQ